MASLVTCFVTSAAWCFCTACTSLLTSCCGNDKSSSIPPSVTSGRKRSVLLLLLALALSLLFQYGVAPAMIKYRNDITSLFLDFIVQKWSDGCDYSAENTTDSDGVRKYSYDDLIVLKEACAGNQGVYRVCATATLFFLLAAVAAKFKPTANREAWPAKYILFVLFCAGSIFVPNDPYFSDIYLNIARIGAVGFILAQQMVIVDVAHNWNDSWVEKSNHAEAEQSGSGQRWLGAILFSCVAVFSAALTGYILLLVYFTGCKANNAFIGVTLVLGIAVVAAQMSGDQGSLLSSACVFAWAVYLCYTAVVKNPDATCNPKLGDPDPLGIIMGLSVTIIGMMWTGWSFTAEDKLSSNTSEDDDDNNRMVNDNYHSTNEGNAKRVEGVVIESYQEETDRDKDSEYVDEAKYNNPNKLSNSWKLNVILAFVTCFMAMALTNWGSVLVDTHSINGSNAANPQVGRTGMWMVIVSQWIAMTLYVWTLVAPRLFPDRDFS